MKKQYLIKITWLDIIINKKGSRVFYEQCKAEEISARVMGKVNYYKGLSGAKHVKATCVEIIKTKEIIIE